MSETKISDLKFSKVYAFMLMDSAVQIATARSAETSLPHSPILNTGQQGSCKGWCKLHQTTCIPFNTPSA